MSHYLKCCFSAHSDWLMHKDLEAWKWHDWWIRSQLKMLECFQLLVPGRQTPVTGDHQWEFTGTSWFLFLSTASMGIFLGWFVLTWCYPSIKYYRTTPTIFQLVIQWNLLFLVLPYPRTHFVLVLLSFCTRGWTPFTPTKQQTQHSNFWLHS